MHSEGYGTWFVGVCSVTTHNETTKEQYQKLQRYTGLYLKLENFAAFKSYDVKTK